MINPMDIVKICAPISVMKLSINPTGINGLRKSVSRVLFSRSCILEFLKDNNLSDYVLHTSLGGVIMLISYMDLERVGMDIHNLDYGELSFTPDESV